MDRKTLMAELLRLSIESLRITRQSLVRVEDSLRTAVKLLEEGKL